MKAAPDLRTALSISAVERETGFSKDTLRVWERRYGFPRPERDANGDRAYPQPQVDKLRLIRRLMDQGQRPGKLIPQSLPELTDLGQALGRAEPDGADPATLQALTDAILQHRGNELRERLRESLDELGLMRFLTDVVAPLNIAVGEAWVRGELAIFEEHLYTELLQNLLRAAVLEVGRAPKPPRVLLATFPNERHALGLLMVEAVLAVHGADCLSLGTQVPLEEMVRAAEVHHADVVGVSFSAAYPPTTIVPGVADLRRQMPAQIDIWVGGAGASRLRRPMEHVAAVRSLAAVAGQLAHWRDAQRAAAPDA